MGGAGDGNLVRRDAEPADRDGFSELVAAAGRPDPHRHFAAGALDRRPIAEQVAGRITAMIKSGHLKPGDRLPTEQQMGIAFGISRPPLREALKALTLMGVLNSRQGGRYTVTDLSPSRLAAPFSTMLSFADYDVGAHFEARTVVDLELVRFCALRATKEERARIMELAVDGRAFHRDPVAFRLLDFEFHQALYDGAGNPMLSALAQGLYDVGLDVRRAASDMPGVIAESVAQHVEVAEAIVGRRSADAVAAYRRHLEHVRDTAIEELGRRAVRP